MNLIKLLNDIANEQDWVFVHSTNFGQNLFDEILESRKTVLMVESPISYTDKLDAYGNKIGESVKAESVMLLRSSELGEPVGNETGYTHDSGRYDNNVVPLRENELPVLLSELQNKCNCVLTQADNKDVYSILDYNLDGILINLAYECND